VLKAICHSAESGWVTVSDLDRVSDLRAEKGNVLWAEAPVAHLTEKDVALIAEEFGLHPLAVEDAVHTRQRPKFEEYENHLFLVMHQLDELNDQLEATQIACFVGPRYVLLLHAGADRTLQEAKRRWKDAEARVTHAADLVHTLVDVVVDDYQVHADRLENETEEIEEIVLNQPHARIDHQLYSLKQQLARLRRYVTPAGRLLDSVLSPNTEKGLSPETAALFNDVHDHLLRIADEIRNVDDLVQAVLDLSRGEQSRALNEVTKQLSGWAAIFAVATLIAGVYGMNFTLIPWGGQVEGFWFAIALMGLLAVTLYLFFKNRNWL
jgi:magnesium transporter